MSVTASRSKVIDFLRGLAVILVLFRHYPEIYDHNPPPFSLTFFGWAGVDLFFILSGFLVSGLLFSEYKKYGNVQPGVFLIRRGFKIYPSFYILIFVTVLYEVLYQGHTLKWQNLLGELVFLQNYVGRMWKQTWSLAVEEHFYFLLAFLLPLFIRKNWLNARSNAMIYTYVGLAVTALGFRILNYYIDPTFSKSNIIHSYPTHIRIDSLFFGVLLSYFYHFRTEWLKNFVEKRTLLLFVLGMALVSVAFIFPGPSVEINLFGFIVLYWGFACLLLASLYSKSYQKIFEIRWTALLLQPLCFMGYYSYSVYLWHVPVKKWGSDLMKYKGLPFLKVHFPALTELQWFQSPYFHLIVYLVISLLVGVVASKIIEFYFLKLRDRYFPSRSGQVLNQTAK